jgi:4-hydroxy-tetrahydrodipicolinate reductase
VICFGLGPVGARIARRLADREGIEIIAAVDVDPAKVGTDFGQLIGRPERRLAITSELPDHQGDPRGVVVHATTSRLANTSAQLFEIMNAGWNIVSTCEELTYPAATDPHLARHLDERARTAGVSVLGTGINPGFLLDTLVLMLSGVCTDVQSVEVRRVVDTDQRRIPLQQKAGVGKSEAEFRQLVAVNGIGHVGLRQSAYLVASRLGWVVDEYQESLEPVLATKDATSGLGPIPAGAVLGQRQQVTLQSGGRTVLRYDLEMSAGAPPLDAVRIVGTPTINQIIEGGVNGDIGTEAIVANLVSVVAASRPGLLTMADIVPLACQQAPMSSANAT